MGPELNGKVLFTYQGNKSRNAKFDNGDGMTAERLLNWGMYNDKNPSQRIEKKDLFALAQKADKNGDGEVTYGELSAVGKFKDYNIDLDPNSKYAKTIFGLMNASKFEAQSYIKDIYATSHTAANSLKTDPDVMEKIKEDYGKEYVDVTNLGRTHDEKALKMALRTDDPVMNRIGPSNHGSLMPVSYVSKDLGERILIVPVHKNGSPYTGGKAVSAHAYTAKTDPNTGKVTYQKLDYDAGKFHKSDEPTVLNQEWTDYLNKHF